MECDWLVLGIASEKAECGTSSEKMRVMARRWQTLPEPGVSVGTLWACPRWARASLSIQGGEFWYSPAASKVVRRLQGERSRGCGECGPWGWGGGGEAKKQLLPQFLLFPHEQPASRGCSRLPSRDGSGCGIAAGATELVTNQLSTSAGCCLWRNKYVNTFKLLAALVS